jgi:membrane dipeptidase
VIGLTPGPPGSESPDGLKAAIETIASVPFQGRAGFEGIAIGTHWLGIARTLPALGDVRRVARWLARTFDRKSAAALIAENARQLLLHAAGAAGETADRAESIPDNKFQIPNGR